MRILLSLAFALVGTLAIPARPAHAAQPRAADPTELFTRYAVAADHPLASQAGAQVLAAGGNAVDAAVATSFALSVVRPFSCGIGGGGFMVIALNSDPRGELTGPIRVAINYRETCPAAVGPDFFERAEQREDEGEPPRHRDTEGAPRGRDGEERKEGWGAGAGNTGGTPVPPPQPKPAARRSALSVHGGRAVATPGTVAGLLHALERYGRKSRAEVLAPAIRLAREGFEVDAAYVKAAMDLAAKFERDPAMKTRFPFVWSRFLKEGHIKPGDRITLPEQAEVLEAIARDGVAGFYRGPVARAIVEAAGQDGGVLTLDDLAGYAIRTSDPIAFDYRGRLVLAMPPPSSGGLAMAQTLGILSRTAAHEHAKDGFAAPYVGLLVESMKHAFADRSRWLADPAYVDVPIARLLSPEYLAARSNSTRIGRILPAAMYGTEPEGEAAPDAAPDDGGTSHLCVVDDQGNAVACTETINLEFGSLVVAGGFCLNNEMDDFTTRRGAANAFGLKQSDRNLPAPGKRPLSSMSPTIVLNAAGEVTMVAGASGGPRIISSTTQVILGVVDFNRTAGQAVAWSRVHHQWSPNVLEYEAAFEEFRWQGLRMVDFLKKLGHQCTIAKSGAAVQAIVRKADGTLEAASDPRKGGKPAGR